jgi:predicted secreted hydrolase
VNAGPFDLVRLALVGLLVTACSGPILANPTLPPAVVATPSVPPPHAPDPQPIVFPRDDGPHDRLTEWWYYTGHLEGDAGRRFGFEAVVFRAERGGVPVTWASHLALTDEPGQRFLYAQRSEIGPQVDRSPRAPDGTPTGFTLMVSGPPPAIDTEAAARRWQLSGTGGHHVVVASTSPSEAAEAGGSFGLNLDLIDNHPATLQGGNGWLDFGPAGSSYYYSVTSLRGGGVVLLDGEQFKVSASAWFDHQWGDFISVGAGGWDWFAVNLDDGTDLMVSLVRAADGSYPLVYGTLVDAEGQSTTLDRGAFQVTADPARTWTSQATRAVYPAGWTIRVPAEELVINLRPTVADQELDTRTTTGVAYWEGSQVVTATRDGKAVGGEAYVELTGYAPRGP